MGMGKYRKKPVVIEAQQYRKDEPPCKGLCNDMECYKKGITLDHVHTIHNNQVVVVEDRDYIISEPDGIHYYPCKPDIFEKTYEPVNEYLCHKQ